MSREPGLTYEGALKILGHRDRKWLERLSGLLGGALLTAGALSGGAAIVPAAVLGWIEPKNEAMELLGKTLDALPGRFRRTHGRERRELIIAAHTTIVVAAYFEALQETMTAEDYRRLKLTDARKQQIAASAISRLYQSETPSISTSFGLNTISFDLIRWYEILDSAIIHVSMSTGASGEARPQGKRIELTLTRYESHFLKLAATVPEFRIYMELSEHATTRAKLATFDELAEMLTGHSSSLARVEQVLAEMALTTTTDLRERVAAVNRAALDESIIPESTARHYGRHLTFPKVRDIFVNPRYRFGITDEGSRLTDDEDWERRLVRDDLDLRLAAHIASVEASTQPLLVLGHPGAGKSLLTRVLAARLSQSGYTVVRVPLRYVGAHSPVSHQIEDALDRSTNSRVRWPDLVDQSHDTVRVVILDGLDELLHQEQSGLYGYLRSVQEFQRNELTQKTPVVVIVTSRTVVADRVDVPIGTPVIKLEEFDDNQIGQWLNAWNEANATGIATGAFRPLDLKIAIEQRTLTAQPLLLMMMAVYVADPKSPVIDEKISPADLYERLLTHFAEREAAKSTKSLSPAEVKASVDLQLRHLSIAALGMLNRGRQDISAQELGKDLEALEGLTGDPAEAGHRVLGKFFFVYVAEARFERPDAPDRRYEFLHATFGEYLVARLVIETLVEATRAAFSSPRDRRKPGDDLLFAMLSFEALSTRLPTLLFAQAVCGRLDDLERANSIEVLTALLAGHRSRHGSDKYQGYKAKPIDRVRELAAYTANLVLLRLAIDPGQSVSLHELFIGVPDPEQSWQSMLSLWQAGLDSESWNSLVDILDRDMNCLLIALYSQGRTGIVQPHYVARLSGDKSLEMTLRFGYAFTEGAFFSQHGDHWLEVNEPWLSKALAEHGNEIITLLQQPPPDANPNETAHFRAKLTMLIKVRSADLSDIQAREITTLLVKNERPDTIALASALITHPILIAQIPELQAPDLFSDPAADLLLRALSGESGQAVSKLRGRSSLGEVPPEILSAVRDLVAAHRWPKATTRRMGLYREDDQIP
ncbi:hypothetical protein GCM10009839_48850 [Catenulispora yoronensis]|uniref:AAA+ ATPase domain-containing protein n=1 Tax=Catenulispora yoronensis TaxID=450799 RepID=A0ABP5G7S1_9ACTN